VPCPAGLSRAGQSQPAASPSRGVLHHPQPGSHLRPFHGTSTSSGGGLRRLPPRLSEKYPSSPAGLGAIPSTWPGEDDLRESVEGRYERRLVASLAEGLGGLRAEASSRFGERDRLKTWPLGPLFVRLPVAPTTGPQAQSMWEPRPYGTPSYTCGRDKCRSRRSYRTAAPQRIFHFTGARCSRAK